MSANTADVKFDYDGALSFACQLWSFADELGRNFANRAGVATGALQAWEGIYAQQFFGRVQDEQTGLANVIEAIRREAQGWAESYKLAIDEQNDRLRQREVDRISESRSTVETIADAVIFGDDSEEHVSAAPEASVPVPPGFVATGYLVRY